MVLMEGGRTVYKKKGESRLMHEDLMGMRAVPGLVVLDNSEVQWNGRRPELDEKSTILRHSHIRNKPSVLIVKEGALQQVIGEVKQILKSSTP